MAHLTVISVALLDREDGGLRVCSEDLPGLILSGPDRAQVAAAIAPAIEAIFDQKGFHGASVRPASPLSEVLKSQSPRDMDLHVLHEQQFVIELPEAA